MDQADGVWYDSDRSSAGGQAVTVYTRDLATGRPAEVRTLAFGSDLPPLSPLARLAFDWGWAYAVWFDADAEAVEIWRFDGSEAPAEQLHVVSVAGRGVADVRTVDADDGYVSFVLSTDDPDADLVGLYHPGPRTVEIFDFGLNVNQLEVMVRGDG